MLKHNSYFEGKVQSVGFERNGRRATAGVIDVGEFHYGAAMVRSLYEEAKQKAAR